MMVTKRGGAGSQRLARDPAELAAKPDAMTSDYIDYVADIIQELQQMAEQRGLSTLGGILHLAHTEARLCQERERQSRSA